MSEIDGREPRVSMKGQMLPGIAGVCMFMIFMTMINVYACLRGTYGTGRAKSTILILCTLLAAGIFGLEAMMIVADKSDTLVLTGNGDVLTPDHGVIAIGSGGNFAQSAALALAENTDLDAETIARKAMKIAAEICIYTNENVTLEAIEL